MDLDEFIKLVRRSEQQNTFFHFTDRANLPLIRAHGLLSTKQLEAKKIEVPARGGNQWSLDADKASGMDAYVHTAFMTGHPMLYYARNDDRIKDPVYLKIQPDVIKLPGAMITLDVANKNGVVPGAPAQMLDDMDLRVIYSRTNWRDQAMMQRVLAARKCELLIPDHIPQDLILNLDHG